MKIDQKKAKNKEQSKNEKEIVAGNCDQHSLRMKEKKGKYPTQAGSCYYAHSSDFCHMANTPKTSKQS